MTNHSLPRLLTTPVQRVGRAMPVVVVTGARQTGKSTLVGELLPGRRAYHTPDDFDVRAPAERTPEEPVARPGPMVLAEVQRTPAQRTPGSPVGREARSGSRAAPRDPPSRTSWTPAVWQEEEAILSTAPQPQDTAGLGALRARLPGAKMRSCS
ncbi:MAG TPA: hypothetical protein VLH75_03095 [Longimicrobiales bacterium]|nr:hypothetical protein [Longimicrobiales bacterium]